ncbi:MAG: FecR domain-containing protein, partial [Kiloniellales bacterium]|nr:FecR domain-containing protein [Kiloniellales bacterium]
MRYEGELGTNVPGPMTVIEAAATGEPIEIPHGEFLLGADFLRQGDDLLLQGSDGLAVLIRGYFALVEPPGLLTAQGDLLQSDLVEALVQANSPLQLAQAGPSGAEDPIGQVQAVEGTVQATRDGATRSLSAGDQVFLGDELETQADGSIDLIFEDGTAFSLTNGGRMVLNELVYDPGGGDNTMVFSVLKGAFAFVSGQIALQEGEGMTVRTPVLQIGVRGTFVTMDVDRGIVVNHIDPRTGLPGKPVLQNAVSSEVLDQANDAVTIESQFDSLDKFTAPPDLLAGFEPLLRRAEAASDAALSTFGFEPGDFSPPGGGEEDGDTGEGGEETEGGSGPEGEEQEGGLDVEEALEPGAGLPGTEELAETVPPPLPSALAADLGPEVAGPPGPAGIEGVPGATDGDSDSTAGDGEDGPANTAEDQGGDLDDVPITPPSDDGGTPAPEPEPDPNPSFAGTEGPDVINAGAGNNVIDAAGGDDVVNAGAGNDDITGGTGNDAVNAGPGSDAINYASGDGSDQIDGGPDADTLTVTGSEEGSNFAITGGGPNLNVEVDGASSSVSAVEEVVVQGGAGPDSVVAEGDLAASGVSNNTLQLFGGASGDNLDSAGVIGVTVEAFGGQGDDTIAGGNVNDTLVGDEGDDTLTGGAGNDSLDGGIGDADVAVFAGDFADNTVTVNGDITVTGADGTDVVTGVEVLRFDDGDVAVDSLGQVTLGVSNAQVTEGEALSFVVSLDQADPDDAVTIDFTVSFAGPGAGNADAGDLTVPSLTGTVTIPAGETSATIDVETFDDALIEGAESFTVTLSNPSANAVLADDTATGTIQDDEPVQATLSIGDAEVTEGGTLFFEVTSSNADQNNPITATFTISFAGPGTGNADAGDLTVPSLTGTVTIPAGATSATIDVETFDDALLEGTETFTVTLSNPSANAVLADDTATGTIQDNDPLATLSIGDAEVTEGGTLVFEVTSSVADQNEPITATFTISFAGPGVGNADAGDLTVPSLTGTVTIPAGETSATIDVGTFDDQVFEGAETFSVTLSNPSANAEIGDGEATGTILDNDPAPLPVLSIGDAEVTEGGTLSFEVTLDQADPEIPVTATFTISFAAAGVGNADAGDLAVPSLTGTVTIPAGETSATIDVETIDDTLIEGAETFAVTLSDPSANAVLADDTAIGTIQDDEPVQAQLSIGDAEVTEGGTLVFEVTSSVADQNAPITATFTISFAGPGAGNADAGDLTVPNLTGTVTIPAGDTSATIDVETFDDTLIEGAETFAVTLSDPSANAVLADDTAIGTIQDDEPVQALLSIGDAEVTEGGTLVFEVTSSVADQNNPITATFTINFAGPGV